MFDVQLNLLYAYIRYQEVLIEARGITIASYYKWYICLINYCDSLPQTAEEFIPLPATRHSAQPGLSFSPHREQMFEVTDCNENFETERTTRVHSSKCGCTSIIDNSFRKR